MKKYLSLLHDNYFVILIVFLTWFWEEALQAEEVSIKPTEPIVAIEQPLQLSVSGLINDIWWRVLGENTGKIEGSTNSAQATYIAPNEVGHYWVKVTGKDNEDQIQSSKVEVQVISPGECEKRPNCSSGESLPNVNVVILIHSGYQNIDGSLQIEENLLTMGKHIYESLKARFYEDNEIYVTPLGFTLEKAFEKAKQQSEKAKQQSENAKVDSLPEEPLVVIFIGDGLPDNLVLTSSDDLLSGQRLDSLLDDYQEATNNQVVVIIDAPYSGTLIDALKGDNRLIISSTNNTEHNISGIKSFIVAYFTQLAGGSSYGKALEFVTNNIKELNQQFLLEDSLDLASLCLNDCFGGLPGPIITIQGFDSGNIIPDAPPVMTPFQPIKFEMPLVNDALAIDVIIEHPHLSSLTIPLERKEADNQWRYTHTFALSGNYNIHFQIQKNNFIVETSPLTLSVINRTTLIDNILHVPVAVPSLDENGEIKNIYYHVQLIQKANSNTLFELDSSRLNTIANTISVEIVRYEPATGSVFIPRLDMPNESKSANLQLIFPITEPIQFSLH